MCITQNDSRICIESIKRFGTTDTPTGASNDIDLCHARGQWLFVLSLLLCVQYTSDCRAANTIGGVTTTT